MAAFFCELFSEEIPARMQARAAEDFARLLGEALAALTPTGVRMFFGPRRIAVAATVAESVAATRSTERGPRVAAPEAALQGFLRKHGAARDALRQEGDFWVLEREAPALGAAALIAGAMPGLLRRFPWAKSMRWGGSSAFTWVRPLRRICCVLDGEVVQFSLAAGEDDGHGLVGGDVSEGHRFHAPGGFAVRDVAAWETELRRRHVIADAAERQRLIVEGLAARAASVGVSVVRDDALVAEVAGLVEWPVALLGRIDAAFMDLPPEVMQVSMRVNQRYFATRGDDGEAAPYFAFVANIEAPDGGAAIVAGNERVLRARFSDARHFWDLDRRCALADRVAALDGVIFHAALGSQGARVRRLVALAGVVADAIGAPAAAAERAALLAKADLTTGMVGEFPELQGVMGGYYARHDGEDAAVADAVRDHYAPRGPTDLTPVNPTSLAVALADKFDQLAGFFAIGEKPTGSGDPYALRRAALGLIRIVRDRRLRLDLPSLLDTAVASVLAQVKSEQRQEAVRKEIQGFLYDRLNVQLRSEGIRSDILLSAHSAVDPRRHDDLLLFVKRVTEISEVLHTDNGLALLAGYRRVSNILRQPAKNGRTGNAGVDQSRLVEPKEKELYAALCETEVTRKMVTIGQYGEAMIALAELRPALDGFFENVRVTDENEHLEKNRLELLSLAQSQYDNVAFFEAIAS